MMDKKNTASLVESDLAMGDALPESKSTQESEVAWVL